MELLYTYTDGSKLYKMSAKALLNVPIWKGNRNIDMNHVATIRESIQDKVMLLDSGYKTIQYNEYEDDEPCKRTYVVDGQHRLSVVGGYFENYPDAPDFFITVTQIKVDSEADVINYFNKINNVKPLHYDEDPNMIMNKYIEPLSKHFNKGIHLIRSGATKRPYLSIEKLRETLRKKVNELKQISVEDFILKCDEINETILKNVTNGTYKILERDKKMIDKIRQLHFGLAWKEKYNWIDELFES